MTRVHNGYASARLDYATGSEGNAYIGLNYAIPSNYDQLNLWVYGDNSGAQLALVTDTGSVNLGALNFSGWKLLTAKLGTATAVTGHDGLVGRPTSSAPCTLTSSCSPTAA